MGERKNPSLPLVESYPLLKEVIQDGRQPNHIFIIPDGNGRWAKKAYGMDTIPFFGHKAGAQRVKNILRDLRELPIGFVTLWGFSADNWKRDDDEVGALMNLFKNMVKENLKELKENNVRFMHLGRKDRIPGGLLEVLSSAEDQTMANNGQVLSLGIDFGGEDQTVRMINKAIQLFPQNQISLETMKRLRDGNGFVPSADLIIRTSGEYRLSDVGWLNGAKTEIYVTNKLLPDMTTKDIIDAIVDYARREKRLGGRPVLT
ncbi:MAG: polyprenyl diphosphate synthase [Candidatus Levybacteria bacterium]|nr:polyprenyl diphosphate synthase [Candidatus Levybacteria bacterium]